MQLARRAALTLGVAFGAALALPAAASAASVGHADHAVAATAATAAAPAARAAVSSQDRAWMVAAHQSNLTEIAAGKAAQQKATTQKVRDLGAMFIRDHTANDAKLTAAAEKLDVSLPSTPNAQQRAALAAVAAKSGAAFDSAWIASQITGHRQTLAKTDTELSSGSDTTVLSLAKATRPVVAHHLEELLAAGGGSVGSVGAGTGGQAAFGEAAPGLALTGLGVVLGGAAGALVLRRRTAE
jgi:putative membrane protein